MVYLIHAIQVNVPIFIILLNGDLTKCRVDKYLPLPDGDALAKSPVVEALLELLATEGL